MSHREKQLKKSAVRVVESDLGVIDLPYLLLTLLLVAIGLLVLFSASYARAYYETKNAASVFVNQLIFAVMGIGVMWLISRVPYEWYQKLSLLILAASIGLLVLVPFIGTESGGATRWLDFGFVSFQPSEIAKFGVICSFAAIMAAHTRDMKTIRYGVAPYVVILGIIAVLLYLEPHMSATLIILALGFILMTLGGTDWKYLVGLVILGCLLVAVYLLTKGYTGGRISAWLHPENDPLDKGLQVLQSQYAIGSGGLEVFGTPFMMAMMEHAAMDCVQPDLPEGKGTVGVDIQSSHLAPTPVGMTVRATATVTGVSENGKLITFRVEASDDWGPIGEGTHTRAIIANDRFLQKCNSKLTERK